MSPPINLIALKEKPPNRRQSQGRNPSTPWWVTGHQHLNQKVISSWRHSQTSVQAAKPWDPRRTDLEPWLQGGLGASVLPWLKPDSLVLSLSVSIIKYLGLKVFVIYISVFLSVIQIFLLVWRIKRERLFLLFKLFVGNASVIFNFK